MAAVAANQRKPYTDAQIRDILSVAPTRTNAKAKAAAYGRTPNAVMQVWYWANASQKDIQRYEKQQNNGQYHPYVRQIYRISRSMGWIARRKKPPLI